MTYARARRPPARVLLRAVPPRLARRRSCRALSRPSSTCSRSAWGWAHSSATSRFAATRTTTSSSSRPGSWPRRRCSSRRSRRAGPCSRRSSGRGSTTRCSRRRCACATSRSRTRSSSPRACSRPRLVYFVVIAAFGAVVLAARSPRDSGRRARRALLLDVHRRVGCPHRQRSLVRRDLPLRDPADVPLLGNVLPDRPAAAGRSSSLAYADAALARRRSLPHARPRRRRRLARARARRVSARVRRSGPRARAPLVSPEARA